MTDRREFLGAMAALFCGVVLPEPVIEIIRVQVVPYSEPDWMKATMQQYMNLVLYPPKGRFLTGIGEPAQQEYIQWTSEQ